jgi:NAD(P)-dependent dehydrogenase (short-subunit alcohol dehydrogenase family)
MRYAMPLACRAPCWLIWSARVNYQGMRHLCQRLIECMVAAFDEVAPVISFVCSDGERWISGVNLPVDGGLASTCR